MLFFASCVCRGANYVINSLAHYACQIDDDVWLEEWSPPPATEALYLDSSFLNIKWMMFVFGFKKKSIPWLDFIYFLNIK